MARSSVAKLLVILVLPSLAQKYTLKYFTVSALYEDTLFKLVSRYST